MAERAAVVDFTVPFYDLVGSTLLMRKKDINKDWFLVIKVFRPEVWGMIFVTFVVTVCILWLFERYSPHSFRNDKSGSEQAEFNLKQCIWFCLILWSPQGYRLFNDRLIIVVLDFRRRSVSEKYQRSLYCRQLVAVWILCFCRFDIELCRVAVCAIAGVPDLIDR